MDAKISAGEPNIGVAPLPLPLRDDDDAAAADDAGAAEPFEPFEPAACPCHALACCTARATVGSALSNESPCSARHCSSARSNTAQRDQNSANDDDSPYARKSDDDDAGDADGV